MVDDLLSGHVTSFRREQGFGVITLDDGRDVKFDASACTMVPNEGAAVRLRIAPARWGGGFKALHVESGDSSSLFEAAMPALDQQIAALQREHLAAALSEHVMARLVADVFGGQLGDATVADVLDAFYADHDASAQHDGYLRHETAAGPADLLARFAVLVPDLALPSVALDDFNDVLRVANEALGAAGDPRRLYPLRTGRDGRACFLLAPDRAHRLAALLMFASNGA